MTISVRWWDEAQTVLYHEYIGGWEWDEYDARIRLAVSMLSSVPYAVASIIDYRHAHLQPAGLLQRVPQTIQDTPANLTYSVILVSDNPLVRTVYHSARRMFGHTTAFRKFHVMFDTTPEQAYQHILAQRRAARSDANTAF